MKTIDTLKGRLERHRVGSKAPKDPRYWPFCICCHLAAPELKGKKPMSPYDNGPQPDISTWGLITTPMRDGNKEQFHLCPDCMAFQVASLVRYHNAQTSKLAQITKSLQQKDKCGLRLEGHLNPFQSAFCCKPKGHTDKCS